MSVTSDLGSPDFVPLEPIEERVSDAAYLAGVAVGLVLVAIFLC